MSKPRILATRRFPDNVEDRLVKTYDVEYMSNEFHADYLSGWSVPLMEKFLTGCAADVEEWVTGTGLIGLISIVILAACRLYDRYKRSNTNDDKSAGYQMLMDDDDSEPGEVIIEPNRTGYGSID